MSDVVAVEDRTFTQEQMVVASTAAYVGGCLSSAAQAFGECEMALFSGGAPSQVHDALDALQEPFADFIGAMNEWRAANGLHEEPLVPDPEDSTPGQDLPGLPEALAELQAILQGANALIEEPVVAVAADQAIGTDEGTADTPDEYGTGL